ncbi:hypothetical protein [Streptomyces sp. NPDC093089]|uniref:hypothetical protein n=1 Tax=Streptomyces sp. NPDC093089 TaxID=3366024 RepID=UPI0037F30BFB
MRKEAGEAPDDGLAGSLLREVAAEPGRLPEALASFALRHLGPGAGPAVERLRAAHPDADPAALRSLIVARGRRRVTAEGAFVGGPFILFIPFAFCGALLSQVRTILELAAAEGRDTTDPERAAELLVLQGVYDDTVTARAALSVTPDEAGRPGRRGLGRWAALWYVVIRMARLLGLMTPDSGAPRWFVRVAQYALATGVFLVGLVAPLVWLPYLAVSYWKATTRLMDRATLFYVDAVDLRVPRAVRGDPAMGLAMLRAAGSLIVAAIAVLVVVTADLQIAGGRWPVLGIVLTSSCLITGGWWVWRRRKRKRRREPTP